MSFQLFLFNLLLCNTVVLAQSLQNIYLSPLTNNTSAPEKLIVFVPGGLVPLENYIPTAQSIQQNSQTRLWVAIVYCLKYLCDPLLDLNQRILGAIQGAKNLGFSSGNNSDIFIIGHSLGGLGARHFIDTYPNDGYAGLGLYGTQYDDGDEGIFIGYPKDLAKFEIPLMAITGELDFVPISHLAYLQVQSWQLPLPLQYQKFGYVIPGMDHSAFCPGFYVKNDIKQEISESDALAAIGKITGGWIDVISLNYLPAFSLFNDTTTAMIMPYLIAVQLDHGTLCSTAQELISGLPKSQYNLLDLHVDNVNSSLQLTLAHTNYSLIGQSLSINVVNFANHFLSLQPQYAGASEIACKIISADRVGQQLNLTVNNTVACSDVNLQTLDYVISLLKYYWPIAITRFNAQGVPISIGNDIQTSAGPVWVLEPLTWQVEKIDQEQQILNVASPACLTTLNSPIYPGNHYCKLMAPTKALEWILTMGLTDRY